MASITYWSQLRPQPRTQSVAEGLAGRVRDPAWLLAGNGSSASSRASTPARPRSPRSPRTPPRSRRRRLGTAAVTLAAGELLEPVVEAEPLTPDLATRVELGQTFESLAPAASPAVPRHLPDRPGRPRRRRSRRPASAPSAPGAPPTASPSTPPPRPRSAPASRCPKHQCSTPRRSPPPPRRSPPSSSGWRPPGARSAPTTRPPGTRPGSNTARPPRPGALTLTAAPDPRRALDWYAFDLASGSPPANPGSVTSSVIPGHVRFRGNARPALVVLRDEQDRLRCHLLPTRATWPSCYSPTSCCCTATTGCLAPLDVPRRLALLDRRAHRHRRLRRHKRHPASRCRPRDAVDAVLNDRPGLRRNRALPCDPRERGRGGAGERAVRRRPPAQGRDGRPSLGDRVPGPGPLRSATARTAVPLPRHRSAVRPRRSSTSCPPRCRRAGFPSFWSRHPKGRPHSSAVLWTTDRVPPPGACCRSSLAQASSCPTGKLPALACACNESRAAREQQMAVHISGSLGASTSARVRHQAASATTRHSRPPTRRHRTLRPPDRTDGLGRCGSQATWLPTLPLRLPCRWATAHARKAPLLICSGG